MSTRQFITKTFDQFIQKCAKLRHVSVPKLFDYKGKYTITGLSMIYFFLHIGKIVEKKDLVAFLRKHGLCKINQPNPRHFGMQNGFYFLVRDSYHPRYRRTLQPGQYCLYTLSKTHPNRIGCGHHRSACLNSSIFDSIKSTYSHRCAVCGSLENSFHLKNNTILTKLEKGHCDPRKPLTVQNCIPICTYCNQLYKNKYAFNKRGCIIRNLV
jgi:hypothetical protein